MVGFGFSEDFILDMDVESFDVLVERVLVVRSAAKIEQLWSGFVSAQGTKKSVKGMAKQLDPKKLLAKGRARSDR